MIISFETVSFEKKKISEKLRNFGNFGAILEKVVH